MTVFNFLELSSVASVIPTLQPYGLQPARVLCPCDSPGKNTGVGCRVLLQGIFPTQGLQVKALPLSHQGSPFNFLRYILFWGGFFGYICWSFRCFAWTFSSCDEQRLLSSCIAWASHCSSFSCCRAWAVGTQAQ